MFAWIAENAATIVIGLLLAAVVLAVTVKLVRDRKKGKTSCGCGCESCAMAGSCCERKK